MSEIELSNRLYETSNGLYVTGSFITSEQKIQAITFIVTKNALVSLRYTKFSFFEKYLNYNQKNRDKALSHTSIFIDLLGAKIGQLADYIEESSHSIDEITQIIFHPQNPLKKHKAKVNYNRIIHQIGKAGDLISKAHESLTSIGRILNFLMVSKNFKPTSERLRKLKILMHDIPPLNEHATFLSSKCNFLLDACLGMINMDQNAIIKIVSVAAIIFFPPTLVASIYGMNFKFMPELQWVMGYPFALTLMALSGLLPYCYFKIKEWI
jgi:magnesium transporter